MVNFNLRITFNIDIFKKQNTFNTLKTITFKFTLKNNFTRQ